MKLNAYYVSGSVKVGNDKDGYVSTHQTFIVAASTAKAAIDFAEAALLDSVQKLIVTDVKLIGDVLAVEM